MHPTLLEKDAATSGLDLAEYLPVLQQRFLRPSPLIFYGDFTLSCIAANGLLYWAAVSEPWSFLQILLIMLSAPVFLRATGFIHEVYHSARHVKGFEAYYNILHGFLHKFPSYCYKTHRHHHQANTYGTARDPEYDILGERPAWFTLIVGPWITMVMLPIFFGIRWTIIPFILPFIGERGRLWVYQHMSSMVLNTKYVRDLPTPHEKQEWYAQDTGCALYSLAVAGLIYVGALPLAILPVWFATIYLVAVINYYRALHNHRYLTGLDDASHKQQIIDSITLLSEWANFWVYPLGMRYHALHHLVPSMPYHSMGKAHQWLMETVPDSHPYKATISVSFTAATRQHIARKF